MAEKNREQRRREKFGGGRASEAGGWPSKRPNPVFTEAGDPVDAVAAVPDQEPESGKATPAPTRKPAAKAPARKTRTPATGTKG
jgi:hypothetical protein